jgi:hypothetical protein
MLTYVATEHLDDSQLHDQWRRLELVAVVDMRMAWLYHRRLLHLHDWKNWGNVPHRVSSGLQIIIWYLGSTMASFQPCCHGLCV